MTHLLSGVQGTENLSTETHQLGGHANEPQEDRYGAHLVGVGDGG